VGESLRGKMKSPQAENGHVDIANELVEAFYALQLSGNEWRVLWVIIRQSYGWHRKTDRISITQFQQRTGLKRRHIVRALNDLTERKIITKNVTTFITTYGFQKDYSQWHLLPKKTHSDIFGNETVTNFGTHKRNKEKRNIASSNSKDASQPSQKKDTDPRIKQLIDYFVQAVQETKEFKPMIAAKDAAQVKRSLKNLSPERIHNQIDFFLSNGKSREHISLSAALSADTYNLYMNTWKRRKWEYDNDPEPPTDKRWW